MSLPCGGGNTGFQMLQDKIRLVTSQELIDSGGSELGDVQIHS
jgi:hypothetical protein